MKAMRLFALAVALFGAAPEASALHYVCELHGAAQFDPGLSISTNPLEPMDFAFQGDLSNCIGDTGGGRHICVVGKLNAPSCAANQTQGDRFVICAGECTSTPGGDAACGHGETPIIDSSFEGACVGAFCTGTNPADGAAYGVVFDAPTIEAALAACNPVLPGEPLTSATFSGFELRQHADRAAEPVRCDARHRHGHACARDRSAEGY
jgi:hypothetical protein